MHLDRGASSLVPVPGAVRLLAVVISPAIRPFGVSVVCLNPRPWDKRHDERVETSKRIMLGLVSVIVRLPLITG